jgi:hypothetical protein
MLKPSRAAAVALVLVLHTSVATRAGMIVGNLDQSTANNANSVKFNAQTLAQQFNVGSQGYTLTAIQANLGNNIDPVTGFARIVTDANGAPGTQVVANFTFPSVPATNPGANVEFDPTSNAVQLAANTHYWFVLGSSAGTGFFEWAYATNTNLTAGSVGTLGSLDSSTDNGATWGALGNTRGLIQVDGTPSAVPEPASFAMLGLGSLVAVGAWLRGRAGRPRPE